MSLNQLPQNSVNTENIYRIHSFQKQQLLLQQANLTYEGQIYQWVLSLDILHNLQPD